jgi:nickel-type superoxide dismutase maturation protease
MVEIRKNTLKDFGLWLLCRRHRFRVTGISMEPTLRAGDEVLVNPRAYQHTLPQPGDVIVLFHPQKYRLKIVKRVHFKDENGRFYVSGDNPAATGGSQNFGTIPLEVIIGRVECFFGSGS